MTDTALQPTEPPKRGKGRPKGSKNVKTLQREEEQRSDLAEQISFTVMPLAQHLETPKTDNEFAQRAIVYFTTCLTMERIPSKGELALHMGYASQESMRGSCDVTTAKCVSAYKRSMEIIEHRYKTLAVQKNSTGSIFLLKSVFGHSDRVDITSQGGSMAPVNLTFAAPTLVSLNNNNEAIDKTERTLTIPGSCDDTPKLT